MVGRYGVDGLIEKLSARADVLAADCKIYYFRGRVDGLSRCSRSIVPR